MDSSKQLHKGLLVISHLLNLYLSALSRDYNDQLFFHQPAIYFKDIVNEIFFGPSWNYLEVSEKQS